MNLVVRASRILKENTNSRKKPQLVNKLEKCRLNYTDACAVAAKVMIEKDIEKKKRYRNSDPSSFFKATGLHMKFDGVACTQSVESIDNALDAAELNYIGDGPPFDPSKLEGVFKGTSRIGLKSDVKFIENRMEILQKVDTQLKDLRAVLAPAVSFIIKMCNLCKKYPSVAKVSRLIFLPTRTIFFLTFFRKFWMI